MGDTDGRGSLQFWDIGLPSLTGYGFKMRDLWEHENIGVYKENYTCNLKPHHCKVFRAELVKN
jgi:alpha-galactosidase